MRIRLFAFSLLLLLVSPFAAYAQAVTEPTETPAAAADEAEPAPVVETPADEAEPAPVVNAPETEAEASAAPTAPTDRIVVTPPEPEIEIGQIDLQALTEEEELPLFVLDGYYRVRANYNRQLGFDADDPDRLERFFKHRLRLRPRLNLNKNVAFNALIDGVDDQVWGSNPGNVLTQSTADQAPNLILKRAWGEITLPFGRLEVGRMPSHWGMGLLSNDGNGFRNIFGDAHGGSTFDRVLFATKPLGADSNLVTALIYDKIVANQPENEVDVLNVSAVDEVVAVLLFNTDPLKAGVYQLYRFQDDTGTALFGTDGYFKLDLGLLYAETEHVFLYGETQAVPVLNRANFKTATPEIDVDQYGYAARIGLNIDPYGFEFEWGNATGDRNGFADVNPDTGKADPEISNYKFHPDYNVGLIMFDYANAIRAERGLAAQVAGLGTLEEQGVIAPEEVEKALSVADLALTDGSVTNAFYIFPKVRYGLLDGRINVTLAYLYATANAPSVIRTQNGVEEFSSYGHEIDLAVDVNFTRDFVFGVQGGYLFSGDYFNRQDFVTGAIIDPADAQLIQGRFTVLF